MLLFAVGESVAISEVGGGGKEVGVVGRVVDTLSFSSASTCSLYIWEMVVGLTSPCLIMYRKVGICRAEFIAFKRNDSFSCC